MNSPTGDKFTLTDEAEPASSAAKKSYPRDKATNNHHVVPLGILVVLCTVYLMAAGVQRNYRYYIRPGVAAFDLPAQPSQADEAMDEELETSSCQQMEIFEKETDQKPSLNLISKRPQGRAIKRAKSGTGNGLVVSKQPRIARSPVKKEATKKSNTAEPIIYLFALVFIYLLLKAASDINQHYKSVRYSSLCPFEIRNCGFSDSRTKETSDCAAARCNPMPRSTSKIAGHPKVFHQKLCPNFKSLTQ